MKDTIDDVLEREWAATEKAKEREHELKMAKLTRDGVDHLTFAAWIVVTAMVTGFICAMIADAVPG